MFVSAGDGLGTGRLSSIEGDGTVRIRYFRCPASDPYVDRIASEEDIEVAVLAVHTRVYVRDTERWLIGRIDGPHPEGDGTYVVAFPNGRGRRMSRDEFEVRWACPIEDPFEILSVLGGDSPVVYEPRLRVISEWHRQRAASTGARGLLLGSVELHDHQLTVVRRVAQDTTRRYLLADEVGLGKTIEAGALIWQCLERQPDARIVILAPDHLRLQWAQELTTRFRVDEFAQSWLRIRAHDAPESWPTQRVDLLVVDEAHRLTRTGRAESSTLNQLADLAHGARDVLLLSATPVRSNEAGFLDLLHLLDPANYRLDDLAGFIRRVEMRDRLALTFQALLPDVDGFELSLFGEELQQMFPSDDLLQELLSRAIDAPDATRPELIGQVREHLSETYRLHHRLLRTRRTADIHTSFGVRGRCRGRPFTLEVEDESAKHRTELLDEFRIHLSALVETGELTTEQAVDGFIDLATRCGSLPQAVLAVVSESPSSPAGRWLAEQGAGWSRPLDSVAEIVSDRIGALLIDRTLARAAGKVVIVSAYTASAVAAADVVCTQRGAHRVARHLSTQTSDENTEAVARWIEDPSCTLLFCDASAEEGINLQTADTMVHLELPWDVFRLEQRIGRSDRFTEEAAESVKSQVVMYGEQRYAQEWFAFVADGCGVFDRSLSSLQHVLADTVRDLTAQVLAGGPAVIDDQLDARREQLAAELDRISAHDALDATNDSHREANDRLLRADADDAFGAAISLWLAGVGSKVRHRKPGATELRRQPRPQVPFNLELAMTRWVDRPFALTRASAVQHRLPIVRAGNDLVDAIAAHLQSDDRGVAYAFLRPAAGHWPPTPTFCIDLLVRPALDKQLLSEAELIGLDGWVSQHIETAMPPIVERVHLLESGVEVTDGRISRAYDKRSGDVNLSSRPAMFRELTAHLDWPSTCRRVSEAALALVRSRPSVAEVPTTAAASLKQDLERRERQRTARGNAGLEVDDMSGWAALAGSVPDVLAHHVSFLGCGATLLADPGELEAST